MKKILFTLLLVLGISAAADAQVRFLDSSTDAVRKEAIAQDKLVFIDLYATWCGPCKAMERDVFSKKEVGDFMDEYFVAAKYDIDKPTGKALAGKHGVRSIPTYLVFNTKGDLLGKITGSMPAEEFTACLLYTSPSPRDRTRSRGGLDRAIRSGELHRKSVLFARIVGNRRKIKYKRVDRHESGGRSVFDHPQIAGLQGRQRFVV